MRDVFVIGAGVGHLSADAHDPRFRRASRQMRLAAAAVEQALDGRRDSKTGVVLGSSRGELEMTIAFLRALSETGAARPIFFQNSLHNSTTGFLSVGAGAGGPLLTISRGEFTGEDALDTARLLIASGELDTCLVVGVDTEVTELGFFGEGAGAVLLSATGQARLLGPDFSAGAGGASALYPADAVEHLARGWLGSPARGRVSLAKSNGATSLEWGA